MGRLPDWVSAKDVILEMLRRHGVQGGVGRIVEYYGPGLESPVGHGPARDRQHGHRTRRHQHRFSVRRSGHGASCKSQGREADWIRDIGRRRRPTTTKPTRSTCSTLEPLIALPSSPGNVVPVREVAGREIYQAYIGSSANPGLRDFAVAALMVGGRQVPDRVSFDVNPTSRQILENLIELGLLQKLIQAGARLHQAGCNGCIGMGQAPATGKISLRTVPRNFPGRSGTLEDQVYLCSPETAAASALTGVITDPRTLGHGLPAFRGAGPLRLNTRHAPAARRTRACRSELEKGPNIKPLPDFEPLPDRLDGPVLLKVGDNISTDEIMPAGAEVLAVSQQHPGNQPLRVFSRSDEAFHERAMAHRRQGFFVVGRRQLRPGLQPRARRPGPALPRAAGWSSPRVSPASTCQNLVNFGILPLIFADPGDYERIDQGDVLEIGDARVALRSGRGITVHNIRRNTRFAAEHGLSARQITAVLEGGLINVVRRRQAVYAVRESAG